MPKYAGCIEASQVLLIGAIIYSASVLYSFIFSIMQWNKALINNSIWLCIFNTVCSLSYVLLFGKDIKFVAIGTATSYVLYSILLLYKLSVKFEKSFIKLVYATLGPIMKMCVPALICYVVCTNKIVGGFISVIIMGYWFIKDWKQKTNED